MVFSEIDCTLRGSWLNQNDNVPQVLKRKSINLCCTNVSWQTTSWRKGSPSDSRSEGCVFKSCRGQARILVQLVTYSCCRVLLQNPRSFFNYDVLQEFESHIHNQTFELEDPSTNRRERFSSNLFTVAQNKKLLLSHLNVQFFAKKYIGNIVGFDLLFKSKSPST